MNAINTNQGHSSLTVNKLNKLATAVQSGPKSWFHTIINKSY